MNSIPVYKVKIVNLNTEEVVWYRRQSSFGFYGFEPVFTETEYHWQA